MVALANEDSNASRPGAGPEPVLRKPQHVLVSETCHSSSAHCAESPAATTPPLLLPIIFRSIGGIGQRHIFLLPSLVAQKRRNFHHIARVLPKLRACTPLVRTPPGLRRARLAISDVLGYLVARPVRRVQAPAPAPLGGRMIPTQPQRGPKARRVEFLIAGFALLALLIGEASMNATIRGTQFAAVDGRMAEAVIRAAFKLAAPFNVTNLNHIQGFGSLLLPFNVWANPAYWPFAFIDGDRAAEVSGLVALASFVIAVYAMARSFDLPPLPSALAAQSCIVLFGPLVMLASGTTVFVLEPGFAVVYAPLMAALGTLARIGPGRVASFILRTSLLLLLLLYSIYGDPLWGLIGGISWSAAFAVVVLSPLRRKPILVRCAALACCVVVLAASGVLEYLYTLLRYTARVQFSSLLMRPADVTYGSVLFTSDYAKYAYGGCILGWMFGLVAVSGRPRVLVVAGAASFVFLLAYATAFVVLQPDWWLPLPIYVEQCIWPLFATAGVAGYWGALRHLGLVARHLAAGGDLRRRLALAGRWPGVPAVAALAAVTVVPAAGILAADRNRQLATAWALPQPNETELVDFLSTQIGLRVGKPFRG